MLTLTACAAEASWEAGLAATPVVVDTELGPLDSARRVDLSWTDPLGVDHLRLHLDDGWRTRALRVEAGTEALRLEDLDAGHAYTLDLTACLDTACLGSHLSTLDLTLPPETWRFQGTGTGTGPTAVAPLHELGNGRAHGRLVSGVAGEGELLQLWFDTSLRERKGISLATAPLPTPADGLPDFELLEEHGLFRGSEVEGEDDYGPGTFELLPLASGELALFFEGLLPEAEANALYRIDSVDGGLGRDFHPGEATACTWEELVPDGACAVTPVLERGELALSGIHQARSLLPQRPGWTWDEAPGAWMLVTVHPEGDLARCSETAFNAAWARWEGEALALELDAGGCPVALPGVQAPAAVAQADGGLRVYLSANEAAEMSYSRKPMAQLHAWPGLTGDPALVEPGDLEPRGDAHPLDLRWPDGSPLTESEQSWLDDHHVFHPDPTAEHLVLYTNLTSEEPFIGMATWLNP